MFKMYNLTKMSKVFSAYEKIQGVENASFCFLFKGKRISETDTPMMLELDEKDLIDCVLAPVAAAAEGEACGFFATITIRVKEQKG